MSKASITCKDTERALDCSMGGPNNDDVFEASLTSKHAEMAACSLA